MILIKINIEIRKWVYYDFSWTYTEIAFNINAQDIKNIKLEWRIRNINSFYKGRSIFKNLLKRERKVEGKFVSFIHSQIKIMINIG